MSLQAPDPRKPWWRRWFGQRSERAAERYLKKQGQRVLARNWTCALGELDLVMRDGDVIVFVEVRSSAQDWQSPAESVNAEKQRRLVRLALAFLKCYGLLGFPARFDVILVRWPGSLRRPEIRHLPCAFVIDPNFSGGSFA
jgi:putative endonuclease